MLKGHESATGRILYVNHINGNEMILLEAIVCNLQASHCGAWS